MIVEHEIAYRNPQNMDEMFERIYWLSDNISEESWKFVYSLRHYRIMFRNTEDATAFKLRFDK